MAYESVICNRCRGRGHLNQVGAPAPVEDPLHTTIPCHKCNGTCFIQKWVPDPPRPVYPGTDPTMDATNFEARAPGARRRPDPIAEAIDAWFERRFSRRTRIWIGIACSPVFGYFAYVLTAIAGWDDGMIILLTAIAALAGFWAVPILAGVVKLVALAAFAGAMILIAAAFVWAVFSLT